jgi:hypothetical protein
MSYHYGLGRHHTGGNIIRKILGLILRKYPALCGAAIRMWNRGSARQCYYVTSGPSAQATCDIFKGEWSSKLPVNATTGNLDLFNDRRLQWLAKEVECEGKIILELGPLEGAHSYMLEKMGAKKIVSVENNSQAYLKCLITKELLGLQRVNFVFADCMEYLKQTEVSFDVCVANGVPYHMASPVQLISLLSKRCHGYLQLWTHYFDEAILKKDPAFKLRFTKEVSASYEGFDHVLHRSNYLHQSKWSGFCGGSESYANWLSREDILNCLAHFGFGEFKINFEEAFTANGPAFALIATKIH